jgi:hypothetical protein
MRTGSFQHSHISQLKNWIQERKVRRFSTTAHSGSR